MADFSLEDLKALRDAARHRNGRDSKNALVEAGGDKEKAVELLRVKAVAPRAMQKRA